MFEKAIVILSKILSKLKCMSNSFSLKRDFKEYMAQLQQRADKPLLTSRIIRLVDMSVREREFFTHLDAFAKYAFEEILPSHKFGGPKARLFDIGSAKSFLAMASLVCDVEALNLSDPLDRYTSVNYINKDISEYEPHSNPYCGTYQYITSMATFHLLGLGRYGDKINASAQDKFVEVCEALLKPGGKLIFSFSLGKDHLVFNNGWVFSLETIKQFFSNFKLLNTIVDRNSSGRVYLRQGEDPNERFVKIDVQAGANYKYRDPGSKGPRYDTALFTFEKL